MRLLLRLKSTENIKIRARTFSFFNNINHLISVVENEGWQKNGIVASEVNLALLTAIIRGDNEKTDGYTDFRL